MYSYTQSKMFNVILPEVLFLVMRERLILPLIHTFIKSMFLGDQNPCLPDSLAAPVATAWLSSHHIALPGGGTLLAVP